jgi:hypothetical protein
LAEEERQKLCGEGEVDGGEFKEIDEGHSMVDRSFFVIHCLKALFNTLLSKCSAADVNDIHSSNDINLLFIGGHCQQLMPQGVQSSALKKNRAFLARQ